MLVNKDNVEICVGVAYKKNVDLAIAGKITTTDFNEFWILVKRDAKKLLITSAEILRELEKERGL